MSPKDSRKTVVLLLGPELSAVSGVSTHLNQLYESSLAHEFDLQSFVVGSEGRPRETKLQKIHRVLTSPLLLAARIVRKRPDIVHINVSLDHKSFPRDSVYLAVARLLRRRVVFQVHGGEMPQDLYRGDLARERFVRPVLEAATVVVLLAQSEFEAYSRFVPKVRLEVIANGIRVEPRTSLETQEHPPVGGADDPLRLAYVGRLVSTKGVAQCIAAAGLLKDAGRSFKLTIAGAGPEEIALRSQAEPLIKQGLVEFVGAKFGEAKDQLWRDSDIFVFPTNHAEGLPYSLLESMAAGTVPITTRVGAQPDVIDHGVHGLFIPPGDPRALFDAIVELDDNRQLLSAMSRQAALRVRRDYSVERLSAEFGDLYRSLVPCETPRSKGDSAITRADT